MDVDIGITLARARRGAQLSQAEVARRMGTTQSVISRLESGRSQPSIATIERFARALGRPITLTVGADAPLGDTERRELVRRALGDFRFDPWRRDPTPAEARTLRADGLTRERFRRSRPS